MPISRFEQVHRATNLGLSRFAMSLPVLLRIALLLLTDQPVNNFACGCTWEWDRGSRVAGSYDRVARIYLILGSKDWEPIDGTQVKRVIKMRAERDESDPLR
jgi:hypothetical protein